MDKGGAEEGESEMKGKHSMEAYALTYIKRFVVIVQLFSCV